MRLTPETAVFISLLLCLAGAVSALAVGRHRRLAGWTAFSFTAAASGLILWAVVSVLSHGPGTPTTFCAIPKLGFALRLHVDGLSSVFLLLAALIALVTVFYSIEYLQHYPQYSAAGYYPFLLVFLAAMYGLVTTTDMMWFFFIFWQMMTLPGYALIRFEHRNPGNKRAASKYLLMMQVACALTMIGAEILVASGAAAANAEGLRYDFESVSHTLPAALSAHAKWVALAFALFLAGFGIKLGMWPFGQIWLPDAHPAAPSPVSAMLSGVMIKTGVYGVIRYFLWLVPIDAQQLYPMGFWGSVIAILGTITLLTGTLQALKQEQSKRLLAFHSIGQVGYILLGIGACLALLPSPDWGLVSLATVGLYGALFHTFNHGLFKSLLFLNAGSMLCATGTQDLNKMGGLLRPMPWTGFAALIASLSIAGVPLFNGFASKWTLYVAGIRGGSATGYLAVCTVVAILTSVLTLASFVKFYGGSFLSRTSALVAGRTAGGAIEAGWLMRLPQLLLAAACIILGVAPALAFQVMDRALDASQQGLGSMLATTVPVRTGLAMGLLERQGNAVLAPLLILTVLSLTFGFAWWLARAGRTPRRRTEAWLGGYDREADYHRYSAHHFYAQIKRWFRWLGGASEARPTGKGDAK